MYRRLLTYLRARVAAARHARDGAPAFWRRNLWRLLAWPLGAAVVLGLGWLFLFQRLEAERSELELKTLQNARTHARWRLRRADPAGRRHDRTDGPVREI